MKKTTRFSTLLLGIILILSMIPFAGISAFAAEVDMITPDKAGLKTMYPGLPVSETNPYLINSVADWLLLLEVETFTGTEYFLQTADLDFSSYTYDATASEYNVDLMQGIGAKFHGIYDGNGHKISGMHVKGNSHLGVFARITGSTIRNLTIENCSFTTTQGNNAYIGGLVGSATGKTTAEGVAELQQTNLIENIVIADTVVLANTEENGGGRFGGIVGDGAMANGAYNHKITIRNCVSSVKLELKKGGQIFFGGIIGITSNTNQSATSTRSAQLTVENCVSYATVTGELAGSAGQIMYIGGIVGETNGEKNTVKNCYADFTVDVKNTDSANPIDTKGTAGIGGIIGGANRSNGTGLNQTTVVENCHAKMSLKNLSDVPAGDLIGDFSGSVLTVTNSTYVDNSAIQAIGSIAKTDAGAVNGTLTDSSAAKTEAEVKKTGAKLLVESISLVHMNAGAAVKINATTDLRFTAQLNNYALAALKGILGDSVTITAKGMILAPTATVEAATAFTKDALTAGSFKDATVTEKDGKIYGATDTVAAADYEKAYSALAYVTVSYKLDGESTATVVTSYATYNADLVSRTVKGVAAEAYADTTKGYTDAQLAIYKTLAGIQ